MTIFAKREGYALPDEVTVNSGRRKLRVPTSVPPAYSITGWTLIP